MTNRWRPMPSNEVRGAWEMAGGRWLLHGYHVQAQLIVLPLDWRTEYPDEVNACYSRPATQWLPVWPGTPEAPDWSYDARGWGDPLVPSHPGWWWRDDCHMPQFVTIDDGSLWWGNDYLEVTDDGHWLGPCEKPEVR